MGFIFIAPFHKAYFYKAHNNKKVYDLTLFSNNSTTETLQVPRIQGPFVCWEWCEWR